jgi:tetratricopeptide (TPR) repeat protein
LWRVLLLLILDVIGIYFLYTQWVGLPTRPTLPMSSTSTPRPTPTRSAVSLSADAIDAYWDGRLTESIAAYRQALNLEPEQPDLYVDLARLLIFRGYPEQALDMTTEALLREPEHALALSVRGLAYDWLGLPAETLPLCDQALALDPALPEAYAYRAEAYVDLGNWVRANTDIEKALELDPDNVDVRRTQGYVLEVQGNYSAAIQAYRRALEIHPGLSYIYRALGRNYEALGNFSRAEQVYQEAIAADPGSVASLDQLAWSYLLRGDYEQVEQYLSQALEIAPTYWPALGHMGTYQFQRRNYEGAIPSFEDAIRYGEAASRRRTVAFQLTLEAADQIGDEPAGERLAQGMFLHPHDVTYPMRATIAGEDAYPTVRGYIRFTPLDGRYVIMLEGLPTPSPGRAYIGWFDTLLTPEETQVRTAPLRPSAQGRIEADGITGPVKGPPIEHYYTLALSHYFLDQCDEASAYINVALRIDPEDANALETQRLCGLP